MKIINNFQFIEWKDKGAVFIFGIIWMFSTYKFVIEPYTEIQNRKKEKISLEIKERKAEKELKEIDRIYQKKYEENKKEEEIYKTYKKLLLEKGFQNSGEMEEYIYQKSKENKLTIELIGGIEKTETKEKEGKVYIPYSLIGEEKNIVKWIEEIENSRKLLSVTDTSFQFQKIEENIKLNLKMAGYLLNDTPKEKNTKNKEKESIFYTYEGKEVVTERNTVEINRKTYLILKFKNGERKIFSDGEKIKKDNEWYTLKIREREVYLEK